MTTKEIPVGRYLLDPALDDRLRAFNGVAPREGDTAHPVFAFVMALGGMGLSIRELSDQLGLAFGDGPVLAGCVLEYHSTLRVGARYDVAAEVAELLRKPSRRFGAADHLHLHIRLSQAGRACAEARLHIIFPAPEHEQA